MVFSSVPFLFFFFTAFFVLYYIAPYRLKNYVLLIFSLLFYAWGEPIYVFLMMFSAGVDWVNGLLLEKHNKKKIFLIVSLVINLGLLAFFKYADFVIGIAAKILGRRLPTLGLSLPVGISFYTFQTVSYTIDVYRGDAKVEHNYFYYLMYVTMFPQLIAGPIVRYQTVADEIRLRWITYENCSEGFNRFIRGLFKKVLLANPLGAIFTAVSGGESISAVAAWLGIIAYAMQIYFDFSGYSDMAIGLGRMMGFTFSENFNYPYIASSVTDFWRRWHISLSTWFRDYVYIPLGGNRVSKKRHVLNLVIVWLLTGLWHGAAFNFILWGLYYGIILIAEKYLYGKYLEKLPGVFKHLYSILIILIGWTIFAFDDMGAMASYFAAMLGKNGFSDAASVYYLKTGIAWFAAGAVCCTPIVDAFLKKKHNIFTEILISLLTAALFVVCVSALVTDSYNPFLYFRF